MDRRKLLITGLFAPAIIRSGGLMRVSTKFVPRYFQLIRDIRGGRELRLIERPSRESGLPVNSMNLTFAHIRSNVRAELMTTSADLDADLEQFLAFQRSWE